MKTFVFALSLCLIVLGGASCVQLSTTQAVQKGTSSQQNNKPMTYVAIGASDTFGIGTDNPYTQNWPTDLTLMLGASHIHLINLGIPGITLHEALKLELPVALDSHPAIVTIWMGVNDIIDNVPSGSFANDLNRLLSSLRANSPGARIAIANIPDLTLLPYFNEHPFDLQALSQHIQAYNAAIDSSAQRYKAGLVDLTEQNYNLKAHPDYISSDGLHPNDIGYIQLATLFYDVLKGH